MVKTILCLHIFLDFQYTLLSETELVSPGVSAWFSLEGQGLYYRHSEN